MLKCFISNAIYDFKKILPSLCDNHQIRSDVEGSALYLKYKPAPLLANMCLNCCFCQSKTIKVSRTISANKAIVVTQRQPSSIISATETHFSSWTARTWLLLWSILYWQSSKYFHFSLLIWFDTSPEASIYLFLMI